MTGRLRCAVAVMVMLSAIQSVAAQQVQILVAPVQLTDTTARLEETTHTTTFSVTNSGSLPDDQRVTFVCTPIGAVVAVTSCPTNRFIARGATIEVSVTVQFGLASAPAAVTLAATPTSPSGNTDTGRRDFTVVAASASFINTGQSYVIPRGKTESRELLLRNFGLAATTFVLSDPASSCTTILSPCSRIPETLTLGANGINNVLVTYTGNSAGVQSADVVASYNGRPLAFGSISVTVVSATVSASPTTVTAAVGQSGVSFQGFLATNGPGSPASSYVARVSCTVVQNCRFSTGQTTRTLTLGPGPFELATLPLLYNTPVAGTGSILIELLVNDQLVSSGSVTVVVGAAAISATVTPTTAARAVTASANPVLDSSFTVTNTSATAQSFTLTLPTCTVVTTCVFQSTSTATWTRTFAAGEAVRIPIRFFAAIAGSGTTVLQVNGSPGALASGTLTVSIAPPSGVTVVATGVFPRFFAPGLSGQTQQFTVTNTGPSTTFTFTDNCATLTVILGCTVTPAQQTLSTNASAAVTVTFGTRTPGGGAGSLRLTASGGTATASDSGRMVVPSATVSGSASQTVPGGGTTAIPFTVSNTTAAPDGVPYFFTAACSTQFGACPVSIGTATLGQNGQQIVSVSLSPPAGAAAGTVTLQARINGTGGAILASSSTSIVVSGTPPPPPPVGTAFSMVSGALLADSALHRDQCVTISVGSDLAAECGDLRIVHPLPTVRTMGVARTPTLVYNSGHARPWVSVPVRLTFSASVPSTLNITTTLSVGGVVRATQFATGGSANTASLFIMSFDVAQAGLTSGLHRYVVRAVGRSGPADSTVRLDSGTVVVVNRTASPFGHGWWLAGLERLDSPGAGVMLWTGGDGSVRAYRLARPGVWGAAALAYPDTIRQVGAEYVRQLPDSVWVTFNALGRHVRTRNRQGHLTTFAYDAAGRLQSIAVPPAGAPLTYTFAYDGGGRLQTVTAPGRNGARVTAVITEPGTGRITRIEDQSAAPRTVQFFYNGNGVVRQRMNGRGNSTLFTYDGAAKLDTTAVQVGQFEEPIVRTLRSWQAGGMSGPVGTVGIRVVFTGPRGDSTRFSLNRFSAPDTVVDAIGQRTALQRTDAFHPALVTRMVTPAGLVVDATYDARGRLVSRSQPSPSGALATTSYQWDPKWDQVTRITNPEGDFSAFGVDGTAGNRIWSEDARGAVSRVVYGYNTANQLEAMTPPGQNPQNYAYDALGNLNQYTNGVDMRWRYTNNAIGLTETTRVPVGTDDRPGWLPEELLLQT
jgi:YD repeat-containing protein